MSFCAEKRVLCALIGLVAMLGPVSAFADEFAESFERDYSIRSVGTLNLSNLRGALTVHGWALDKIRVLAKRKVTAATAEDARKLFSSIDIRYRAIDGDIELAAEYGKNLDLRERLRERQSPKAAMELVVYAPSNLDLKLWASGEITVQGWNSKHLEMRGETGKITLQKSKFEQASVTCVRCEIEARALQGDLRCLGGAGQLILNSIHSPHLYTETSSGSQILSQIDGDQLYVSKSGAIRGEHLRGKIEFHTQAGPVHIRESAGFMSGHSESGAVDAQMLSWAPIDRALIETQNGNVTLQLPASFSSEVDLWSLKGHVALGFHSDSLGEDESYGPSPINHLRARVGSSSDQLQIRSQSGDIRVSKIQ